MPARLIVNADDFGLTRGINRAIGELNSAGVLTSSTLMANGPAFDDAVAVAHAHPTLGVGCHIVLTDGIPVSPPEEIPSLLGPDGKSFRPSLTNFLQALLLNRINEDEVARESLAQIQKLQRAGVHVTHVDTHKHTHLFPAIARPILNMCEHASVSAIRNPFEPAWSLALDHGSPSRRLVIRLLGRLRPRFEDIVNSHNGTVVTTDGTVAISATGELTAATLIELLAALPASGTYELCCHPGYNDTDLDQISTRLRTHRQVEREALLDEISRHFTQTGGPTLANYEDLISQL